jgi:DnaJ family protein C protein 28
MKIINSPRISPLALWDPQMSMSSAMPSGLASLAELKIRTAMREGVFDDLEGHGRPSQPGFDSPFVDSNDAVMNRVLVKNGVTPAWIEVIFRDSIRLSPFSEDPFRSLVRKCSREGYR